MRAKPRNHFPAAKRAILSRKYSARVKFLGRPPRGQEVERAMSLLLTLSDGKLWRLDVLADGLGVCTRTVRRYFEAFDKAGFAIETDDWSDGNQRARTHYQLVNPNTARAVLSRRIRRVLQ